VKSYEYSRYIQHLTRSPWALLPEKFEVIADLIRRRATGYRPSDEEIADLMVHADGGRASAGLGRTADGAIAVVPIIGTIAHRGNSFEGSSGGTSADLIGRMLDRVVSDSSVSTIVLDISSPGGNVFGVPELAAKIAKATETKPVIAMINAMAASAAFWLASQASEIVITPSGMAGSIGVFMLAIDESEALAKAGVKVNAISAGEYKLEGAPWEPLSDDARAYLQAQVNSTYKNFKGDVARGRNVSVADVEKNYGRGRMLDARAALTAGMVDRIATFDDTLLRLAGSAVTRTYAKSGRSARALTAEEQRIADEHAVLLAYREAADKAAREAERARRRAEATR
jgi:capsid assembly protease